MSAPTLISGPLAPSGTKVVRATPGRHGKRRWIATLIAIVFSLIWVFPVYWMINTALKPQSEVMTPTPLFFPLHPTLSNFIDAVNNSTFLDNLRSSLIVVVASVLVSAAIAFFACAALTRFRFRGRRVIMVTILVVQMLPSVALLIPTFLVFNDFNLVGSYLGLILAYIAMVLPFSIWILRGFFIAVPVEIEEAARVDGASDWRILRSVLFPLVAPGIISTSIFAFIAAWNEYILAYTFMKDNTMYTLPIWLASFSTPHSGTDFGGQMAASVLFSLPVVIFFLIIQRKLVSGIAAGAVKG
ncbi:MAG TPA: carbohydrate ABC transporter permease [Galbitalea sp.]|nr:carbohydrate ABC transporter permease [Galbitalea sp.]